MEIPVLHVYEYIERRLIYGVVFDLKPQKLENAVDLKQIANVLFSQSYKLYC